MDRRTDRCSDDCLIRPIEVMVHLQPLFCPHKISCICVEQTRPTVASAEDWALPASSQSILFGFFVAPHQTPPLFRPVIKLSTDGAHPEGRWMLSFGWDGVSPVKYVWGPWAQKMRELLPFSVLFPPLYSSPSHFLHVKCRKAAGSHFASPPSVKPHDSYTRARTDTPLHAT